VVQRCEPVSSDYLSLVDGKWQIAKSSEDVSHTYEFSFPNSFHCTNSLSKGPILMLWPYINRQSVKTFPRPTGKRLKGKELRGIDSVNRLSKLGDIGERLQVCAKISF